MSKSFMDFGGIKDSVMKMKTAFKARVDPWDVLVGAIAAQTVGKAIGGIVRKHLTKDGAPAADSLKGKLVTYSDELGGIVTGGVLFVAQKGQGRAAGHLVGAVGGALLPPVTTFLTAKAVEYKLPGFGELLPINYGNYGELVAMGELKAMGDFSDFSDFNGIEEEAVI